MKTLEPKVVCGDVTPWFQVRRRAGLVPTRLNHLTPPEPRLGRHATDRRGGCCLHRLDTRRMMHPDSSMFSIPGVIWYHPVSFPAAISPPMHRTEFLEKVFLGKYLAGHGCPSSAFPWSGGRSRPVTGLRAIFGVRLLEKELLNFQP